MGARPVPIPLAAVSVNATNSVGSVERLAQETLGTVRNVVSPSVGAAGGKTSPPRDSATFATPTKAVAAEGEEGERSPKKRQAGEASPVSQSVARTSPLAGRSRLWPEKGEGRKGRLCC